MSELTTLQTVIVFQMFYTTLILIIIGYIMNTILAKTLLKKGLLILVSRKLNENRDDPQKSDFKGSLILPAAGGLAMVIEGLAQIAVQMGLIEQSVIQVIMSLL